MTQISDIFRRALCILALLTSFIIVGAPGGGGGGGGASGGGFGWGGGYGNGSYGSNGLENGSGAVRTTPTQSVIRLALLAGLIGFGFWLVNRGRFFARPATLRITVGVLLEGDAEKHAQFFDQVLKTSSFALPQERVVALRRVLEYLETAVIADGFTEERSFSSQKQASDTAERLSKRQTNRVDAPRSVVSLGAPSCVVGFTVTTTPDQAGSLDSLSGKERAVERLRQLSWISERSLDSFYLFYSPAPGEILSRTQADTMLRDLQKMVVSPPSKAA